MALVNYASSDEESGSGATDSGSQTEATMTTSSQPAKKRKTSHAEEAGKAATKLPPLPSSFHDLYASTVRVSTVDDPTLHQGRKRQIPHIVGNWPTHLYVEWHPTSSQHALLTSLLEALQVRISSDSGRSTTTAPNTKLSTFLTSDLGAPLPLHISLSRPIVLTTAQKDQFLSQIQTAISSSSTPPFTLTCRALEWHRTSESARSFLVLRVLTSARDDDKDDPAADADKRSSNGISGGSSNPQLSALLARCNDTVKSFGQPALYAFRGTKGLDTAFHISIAWSFVEPTAELRKATEEVFSSAEYRDAVQAMPVRVDGVKAKIGNVVTHLSLPT